MAETLPGLVGNKNYAVGKGCPNNDPAANVALASNNKANNLSAIAKNVGMTQKCQQKARLQTDQFMTNTKAAAFMFPLGGAAVANTTTNNTLDHQMSQSGCGAFSLTANTMMNETNNITCNINSTYSGQTQTAQVNASINLKTVRPPPDTVKSNNATIATNSAVLASMSTPENMPQPPPPGGNMEAFKMLMNLKQIAITQKAAANALFIKQNPSSAGVFNSNINLVLKQDIKMKTVQNVTSDMHAKIQNSVKNIASAVAFNKVSQATGVDSLTSNSKQFLQNKVTNAVNNQTNNIKSQISQSKMHLGADGSINLTFAGPVDGSNIEANLTSQASMQVNQIITSAVTIGASVAADITNDIASTSESDAKDAGLADMIKAANAGLAEQIKTSDAGQNKFFKGFFSMIGNMWLMLGIAAIAILMFFPQVTKIFPPPIRFALMGVIAVLILFWWFGIWPFSKDNFAASNVALDTLSGKDGKDISWHRTYSNAGTSRGRKPYPFNPAGNWDLN